MIIFSYYMTIRNSGRKLVWLTIIIPTKANIFTNVKHEKFNSCVPSYHREKEEHLIKMS
jgi:hypothetical protein